jgi:hypothetical protein
MACRSSKVPVAVEPAVATTAITARPLAASSSSVRRSAGTLMPCRSDGTTTTARIPSPSSATARVMA